MIRVRPQAAGAVTSPAMVRPGNPTARLLPLLILALGLTASGCANFTRQADEQVLAPRTGHSFTPSDFGLPFEEQQLEVADGVSLAVWWIPAAVGTPGVDKGPGRTALLCCPADANIGDLHPWYRFLHDGGWNVVAWDPRGFGKSGGVPSLTATVRDVRRVARFASETWRFPMGRLVSYGIGLGSGSATALLAGDRRVAAAVCDGVTSAAKEADLPTLAITEDVEVENNLPKIQAPVLLVQGVAAPKNNRWALERAHRYGRYRADLWELPACGTPPSALLSHDVTFQNAVLDWMAHALDGGPALEVPWDEPVSDLAWGARAYWETRELHAAVVASLEPGQLPDAMPARQLAYQLQLRLTNRDFDPMAHAAFAPVYLDIAKALLRSADERDQNAAYQWLLLASEAEPEDPRPFFWSTGTGGFQSGWPHQAVVQEARQLLEGG